HVDPFHLGEAHDRRSRIEPLDTQVSKRSRTVHTQVHHIALGLRPGLFDLFSESLSFAFCRKLILRRSFLLCHSFFPYLRVIALHGSVTLQRRSSGCPDGASCSAPAPRLSRQHPHLFRAQYLQSLLPMS